MPCDPKEPHKDHPACKNKITVEGHTDNVGYHPIESTDDLPEDILEEMSTKKVYTDIEDSSPINIEHIRSQEGGIHFQPPTKIAWGALGSGLVFAVIVIAGALRVYHEQQSLNARLEERVTQLHQEVYRLKENTYTKFEDDLRITNIIEDIRRHDIILERNNNAYQSRSETGSYNSGVYRGDTTQAKDLNRGEGVK